MLTTVRRGSTSWRRAAARAIGTSAVLLMAAVAAASLLLPPEAEADRQSATTPTERDAPPTRPQPAPAPPGRRPAASSVLAPAVPTSAAPRSPPCGGSGFAGKVNLNSAGEHELDLLPGIGPAKAKRIVDWRASHGPFQRLRDLRRVKGFGRKTVLKLTPHLTLDGPTTASSGRGPPGRPSHTTR